MREAGSKSNRAFLMSSLTASSGICALLRQLGVEAGRHQPGGISRSAGSAAHSYRPEIDGLRAIAVFAVITEHVSSSLLPGGYLGVDLFFVISGFVISSSLAAETHLSLKEFLVRFYVRRIKRLLPALVLCVLATAVVASMVIDAGTREYQTMIMSGAWALLGVSNVYFFDKATDYFATSTELNPFAHTWSLGVEEQFYLLYPAIFLFLSAGVRRGAAIRYICGFTLLIALSMMGFLLLLDRLPAASYFLAPMRFWELGIGCLAYFFYTNSKYAALLQREWVAMMSLILLGAAFAMTRTLEGVATPLTVVASAVLITSLRPGLLLCRMLSLRPIVWVGLISYSLYLWHWSVLSIAHWTIDVTLATAPILLALMLALATGSYLFVERPLRYQRWSPSTLRTIGLGISVSAAAFACMLALRFPLRGELYTGAPAQLAQANHSLLTENAADGTPLWHGQRCVLASDNDVGKSIDLRVCLLGGERRPGERLFLVIGDSFSAAERDLVSALREERLGAVALTSSFGASAAPGLVTISNAHAANDYYWSSVVPALLQELRSGDSLVMIFSITDLTPAKPDTKSQARLRSFGQELAKLAGEMQARGVNIVFQSGTPYTHMRDANCTPDMARKQWFNVRGSPLCKYLSKTETLRRRIPLANLLADIKRSHPNFYILDLMPVLCPGEVCRMQSGDTFLYRDFRAHLTVEASRQARPLLTEIVRGFTSLPAGG
jgi:peptidoglycan/LPS O-acetylase OafA/YrhL